MDRRWLGLIVVVVAIPLLVLLIDLMPGPGERMSQSGFIGLRGETVTDASKSVAVELARERRFGFEEGVRLLQSGDHEGAASVLRHVLELDPQLVEAHVNMGFALLGMDKPELAQASFMHAIDLRATQANAYYGLALCYESAGDLEMALGSMRSYIHLSAPSDRYLTKARAAILEWESTLAARVTQQTRSKSEDR